MRADNSLLFTITWSFIKHGPAIVLVLIVPADDMMMIREKLTFDKFVEASFAHCIMCTISIYVVSTCTIRECMETLLRKYFSSVDNIFMIATCWHSYWMRTLQSNQITLLMLPISKFLLVMIHLIWHLSVICPSKLWGYITARSQVTSCKVLYKWGPC